jgi:polyferredoxin/Flp pilus assembly protein TadD
MKTDCESKISGPKRSVALPVLASGTKAAPVAKSRASRWRAGALIALNVAMLVHIVQWKLTGSTISPIEPSESMATLQEGAINAGFVFFSLAILATLIFGRFVCGWACHVVALQDLCHWLMKKMGITPRPFRSRLLIYVPVLVAIYMFVWPTVLRAVTKPAEAPLIPGFTNHLVATDFWATFPPILVAIPFLFVVGFMTVYFLGSKGFCTYMCPYGGVFAVADRVAPGRIRVTDACNSCGHCTAVCTSNVRVHSEVKQFGMVVDAGCMKCMDCVSVCPTDALYFGFAKPIGLGKTTKKKYSLSWPEEILAAAVFAGAYFAAWDVYQLVPMLMALAIAGVTTFLFVRVLKLLRARDLSFYKHNLKAGGKLKMAGFVFLLLSGLWIGVNAHSGFIRYHERAGALAFQNLQIPDELALASVNSAFWLSPADRASIDAGSASFGTARRYGLFTNTEALPKFAWLEYLAGRPERAVDLLQTAANRQSGQARALSLYYRGAILNRLGLHDQAIRNLDEALVASPSIVLAREEKGAALWKLGRRAEAAAVWSDAIRGGSGLPLSNYFLAGASGALGRAEAAATYEAQGERISPADPYFQWMLGLRLRDLGMNELADKKFAKAVELDPRFRTLTPPA